MGIVKKIGLGIGISVLIFFALVIIAYPPDIEDPKEQSVKKVKFENMSFESLEKISQDWTFKDILRNIDNYEGKIIYIDGEVAKTLKSMDMMTLCVKDNTFLCDEHMFVNVNGKTTWLEDDKLNGFVMVESLRERGKVSPTTGEIIGTENYIPEVKEIKLTCSNC